MIRCGRGPIRASLFGIVASELQPIDVRPPCSTPMPVVINSLTDKHSTNTHCYIIWREKHRNSDCRWDPIWQRYLEMILMPSWRLANGGQYAKAAALRNVQATTVKRTRISPILISRAVKEHTLQPVVSVIALDLRYARRSRLTLSGITSWNSSHDH
jgi:hypothetical protein